MATKKLTTVVIDALEDIKARDIKLINVAKLTSVFDYIVIASADSTRQTKALAKNVMDKVKESGGWIYGIEGEQSGEWVLVDCGDVVVHIMQPVMREHYKLEELWGEGKLEYPKPAAPKRKPAAPKATEKTKIAGKVKSTKKVAARSKDAPKTAPKTATRKSTKAKPATTSGAMSKVVKVKKTATKAKRVTKKVPVKIATKVTKKMVAGVAKKVPQKVTKKAGITARKKVAPATVKKAVTKKTVAKKPAIRRRKATE